MLLKDLIPESYDEWRYERTRFSPRTQGSHWSPIRQTTRLPAPSRRYVHGDPIRAIDWRAWARTDQLLVRELREDASVPVEVHFEATHAMDWPDDPARRAAGRDTVSKADWAWRAACHICFGHVRMGDRVDLWIWGDRPDRDGLALRVRLPLGGAKAIRNAYAAGWAALHAESGKPAEHGRQIHELADGTTTPAGTIYWLGDGLTDPGVMRHHLARAKAGALLHCLSSMELDPEWMTPSHCYVDDEPPHKEYLGESLLAGGAYLERVRAWQSELQHWCQQKGMSYGVFTEQTPVEAYLRFLAMVGGSVRGQGRNAR